MTKKSRNILLLTLSLLLSLMVFIPTGVKNDWSIWLYFLAIVALCLASCIGGWNSDYAFGPVPLEKMSRKDKILHFTSFFILIMGIDFMLGMFGDGSILVVIGSIIVVAFSFVQRYLSNNYRK